MLTQRNKEQREDFDEDGNGKYLLPCLPVELLHYIFDYLEPADLSRAACVCKLWHNVVLSLDITTWKRHFLIDFAHLEPFWPLSATTVIWKPSSWRLAYQYNYAMQNMWLRKSTHKRSQVSSTRRHGHPRRSERDRRVGRHDHSAVINNSSVRGAACNCIPRRTGRRVLRVDRAPPAYVSIRNALGDAREFDRIEVCAGVYDETEDVSIRTQVELVGIKNGAAEDDGQAAQHHNSVIIAASLAVKSHTARFAHITFRAPWYSSYALQVQAGFLQVEHCTFEDCRVVVQSDAVCTFRYCHFLRAPVSTSRVHRTLFENCLFESFDLDLVSVIGAPKKQQNWVTDHLEAYLRWYDNEKREAKQAEEADANNHDVRQQHDTNSSSNQQAPENDQADANPFSKSYIARILSVFQKTRNRVLPNAENDAADQEKAANRDQSRHPSGTDAGREHEAGDRQQDAVPLELVEMTSMKLPSEIAVTDSGIDDLHISGAASKLTQTTFTSAFDLPSIALNMEGEMGRLPLVSSSTDGPMVASDMPSSSDAASVPLNSQPIAQAERASPSSTTFAQDSEKLNAVGPSRPGSRNNSAQRAREDRESKDHFAIHSDRSDSEDGEQLETDYEIDLDTENDELGQSTSQSLFACLRSSLQKPVRMDTRKVSVNAAALNDFYSLPIEQRRFPRENAEAVYFAKRLKGALFRRCKFINTTGGQNAAGCGISVTDGGECCVIDCEFTSLYIGVRVTFSTAIVYRNHVHDCRNVGVSYSEYASGAIVCNDVHHCASSCIELQRYADPILQSNRVHHSEAHGIVLSKACSLILNNDIFENSRDGLIIHRSEAIISGNRISGGESCGVQVLLDSRALITENIVTENRLSGIHIHCTAKRDALTKARTKAHLHQTQRLYAQSHSHSHRRALHDALRRPRHDNSSGKHEASETSERKRPLCIAMCNFVCSGLQDGVSIAADAMNAVVINNVILNNRGCGVWMQSPFNAHIFANQISGNREHGIANFNLSEPDQSKSKSSQPPPHQPPPPALAPAPAPAPAPVPDESASNVRQRQRQPRLSVPFPAEFATDARIVRLRLSGFLDSRTVARQRARMKLDFDYYLRAAIEFNPSVHDRFKRLLIEQGGDVMKGLLQWGQSVDSLATTGGTQPIWRVEGNTAFQNGRDAIYIESSQRIAEISHDPTNTFVAVLVIHNTCFANRSNGISLVAKRRDIDADQADNYCAFSRVDLQSNHVACNGSNGIAIFVRPDESESEKENDPVPVVPGPGPRPPSATWSYSMSSVFAGTNSGMNAAVATVVSHGNADAVVQKGRESDGKPYFSSILHARLADNGVYDNLDNGVLVRLASKSRRCVKLELEHSDFLGNGGHALRVMRSNGRRPSRGDGRHVIDTPPSPLVTATKLELDVARNRFYSHRNMVVQLPDDSSEMDVISASIMYNTVLTDDRVVGNSDGCSYAVPFWLDATGCRGLKIDGNHVRTLLSQSQSQPSASQTQTQAQNQSQTLNSSGSNLRAKQRQRPRPMLNHYQINDPPLCPRAGLQNEGSQNLEEKFHLRSLANSAKSEINTTSPPCVSCCACASKTCCVL